MGHYQVAHDARTPLRQQSAPSALSRSWAANRHGRRSAPGAEETVPRMSARRKPREKSARLRLGAYEFTKKGVSRFDLRDPYHLAITLTWPQFLAALFALSTLCPAPLVHVPAVAGDILVGSYADQSLLLQIALDRAALRGEGHLVEQDLLDLRVGLNALGLLGLG